MVDFNKTLQYLQKICTVKFIYCLEILTIKKRTCGIIICFIDRKILFMKIHFVKISAFKFPLSWTHTNAFPFLFFTAFISRLHFLFLFISVSVTLLFFFACLLNVLSNVKHPLNKHKYHILRSLRLFALDEWLWAVIFCINAQIYSNDRGVTTTKTFICQHAKHGGHW